MCLFMSQNTVSMNFTDCYARDFFFTAESACFHSIDWFYNSDSKLKVHVLLIHKCLYV